MRSWTYACMCVVFVPMLGLATQTTSAEITQITNNDLDDLHPSISESLIAWEGDDGGGDTEIFLYDRSTATVSALTDNDIDDSNPAVSGSRVAWQGLVSTGEGCCGDDWEIFLHEGSTTLQLTDDTHSVGYNADDTDPDISGSRVVWKGYVGIVGPAFDERMLFIYDGLETISTWGAGPPAISGERIVYQEDFVFPFRIALIDLSVGLRAQLLESECISFDPDISGSDVVWGCAPGAGSEIYLHSSAGLQRLTDNATSDSRPAISGSNVVWQGWDGNDWEIFFWDGSGAVQLTDNDVDDERPDVWGQTGVWQAADGNDLEIFMTTVPEPAARWAIAAAMLTLGMLYRSRAGLRDVALDAPPETHP